MKTLLAISGSLRAISYNSAALRAARDVAPSGVMIDLYEEMARLPHFNPDLEVDPLPQEVVRLRQRVGSASGLVLACPEYAHGIPGAFKNLLDWLVGGPEFVEKPVMLINCSPRASEAQMALRNVITTMNGKLVDACCISLPLLGSGFDTGQILADAAMCATLAAALDKFAATT